MLNHESSTVCYHSTAKLMILPSTVLSKRLTPVEPRNEEASKARSSVPVASGDGKSSAQPLIPGSRLPPRITPRERC